jgi:hypothetical protein
MAKLKQSFHNATDRPQFINLQLSTARFRLDPGEILVLFYDADEVQDELGASVRIEFVRGHDAFEIVVWTRGDKLFRLDGTAAPQDFNPA